MHALLGANGAGKSTLVKVLTGRHPPDGGTISVSGKPVRARSPAQAARLGLAPVFQDPALVPDLTVAQNLRLRERPVDAVRRRLAEMDLDVDFNELAADVPLPMLRMIDLARALAREPAAAPPRRDHRRAPVRPRRARLRRHAVVAKERGRSVLFITHRLAR